MLQRVIYPILRPIMRAVLLFPSGVFTPTLPRPLDSPHAHASGPNPDRILLYGSGPSVGYGVLSHELALPGQLARAVSALTGRGVDVDVDAKTDVLITTTQAELQKLDLWRYDAIVLTIGVKDVLQLTSLRSWRRATGTLFAYLDKELPKRTKVLVVAIPPLQETGLFPNNVVWLADRHSVLLNRTTKRAASGFPRITYVPFSPLMLADKTSYQNASIYVHWARILAAPLSQQLSEIEKDALPPSLSAGEDARQKAVDELNILETEPEERFDRITRLACQMLDLPSSMIAFIDHDRYWVKSQVKMPIKEIARDTSPSGYSARRPVVRLIEDLTKNEYLSKISLVVGEPFLRFYASYPIESAYGEPVGIIAVAGPESRPWSEADTTLLRDLAIMVQRELGE